MDPLVYNEVRTRPSLEERLESIISGAALMADSSCTRDERRERIVAECNAVRQALQDLLSEYMSNVSLFRLSNQYKICFLNNTFNLYSIKNYYFYVGVCSNCNSKGSEKGYGFCKKQNCSSLHLTLNF